MSRKLINLGACITLFGIAGCNVGSTPTISASVPSNRDTSSCQELSNTNRTCTISVVYNTNGVSGVSLGYTPDPLPASITNGTFSTTLGTCQSGVAASSGSTTCSIVITYTPVSGGTNTTITFTLGNATSNKITIKGS